MAKAERAHITGADSTNVVNLTAATKPVFTPASGEVTYAGGCIQLAAQLARALTMLAAAEGEILSYADVDQVFGRATEIPGSRRQLLTRLRSQLAPAGIEIEHRKGFGFRLTSPLDLRLPAARTRAADALRLVDEALRFFPPAPRPRHLPKHLPKHLRELTDEQLRDFYFLRSKGYRSTDALALARKEGATVRVPTLHELKARAG